MTHGSSDPSNLLATDSRNKDMVVDTMMKED
jgi:hypothetical protein